MLLAFGAALLCAAVILGASLVAIRSITRSHTSITEQDFRHLSSTQKLLSAVERRSIHLRSYLLTGNATFLVRAQEAETDVERLVETLKEVTLTYRGKTLLSEIERLIEEDRNRVDDFVAIAPKLSRRELAKQFELQIRPVGARLRDRLDELVIYKEEKVRTAMETAHDTAGTATRLVVLMAVFALALTLILTVVTTRTLSRLYGKLQRALAEEENLANRLKKTNDELDRFASAASHDLQEPLRTIGTFLQLLELKNRHVLDKESKEYMHFVLDGCRRLKALVEALLVYSRTGHWPLEAERISLENIVKRTLQDLKKTIDESNTHVEWNALPEVWGDSMQISQLFQNLISNAIKYRREEKTRIEISAHPLESRWLISVRDNGIGIDTKDSDRVFESFRRLHSGKSIPGTGLGLSVCKNIVERHGGKIWCESVLGQGSVFYFTLPEAPKQTQNRDRVVPLHSVTKHG